MSFRVTICAAAAAALLSACNKPAELSCASPAAHDVISGIITDEVVKKTDAGDDASPSAIRAAVAKIKILIADVRTTKQDPDSTKRFCEGTVKVVIPLDILQQAEKTREIASLGSAASLLESVGFERAADTFTRQMSFSVQPTDDGQKIFGEIEGFNSQIAALAEVVASQLLLTKVEEANQATQLAAKAQQDQVAQQAEADKQLAIAENKLAKQTINEVWKNLPEGSQSQLLDIQRAWIAKKEVDCNIKAAETSVDPVLKETARLQCDTELTKARTVELQKILY